MSTLNVSNITDGTDTVGTSYVVNGSAKAWLEASSSASLNNSHNISSGTDNGTGNYTYSFVSSFSGNWSPSGIVTQNSSYIEYLQTLSAGSGQLRVSSDSGTPVDSLNAMTIHGDLA